MDRSTDHCTMFKNGNINIRFRKESERKQMGNHLREYLLAELFFLDVGAIGEPFSMGNFTMGQTLFNLRTNQCYTLDLGGDIATLTEGKSVKLFARTPDENDRELIESEFGFKASQAEPRKRMGA